MSPVGHTPPRRGLRHRARDRLGKPHDVETDIGRQPGGRALRSPPGQCLRGVEAVVGQANGRRSLAALNKDELSLLLFTLMIDHAFVMSDPTGGKDQPIVR